MRTRVGYCGGKKDRPTYRDLGDHTETLQIDFDPARISFQDLLKRFFGMHNACRRPFSRQYASIIFWHDEDQKRDALKAKAVHEQETNARVQTELSKFDRFWLAEDYHQKYALRQVREIAREYLAIYPKLEDFVNSTAAARVNGWLGGEVPQADIKRDLPDVGLSPEGQKLLRKLLDLGS